MVDLESLKRVDKDAGIEVLQSWLFDLPELSYLRSIDVVKQQNDIRSLEDIKESLERDVMLSVDGKSKEIREAEAGKKLSELGSYLEYKKKIQEEYVKLETLKAQRAYYDAMFGVVKNECYFHKSMKQLELNREMKKETAESFTVKRQE